MPLSDAECARLLDTWPVARLATIAASGRANLVPIVFARVHGVLWSPIDGKPKSGSKLARASAIQHDERVTVLLDHYDDDWNQLWWLRVDGRASLVAGEVEAEAALRAKYPQYATTSLYHARPLLVRIAVEATSSWTATPSR